MSHKAAKDRRKRQIEFINEDLLTCRPLESYDAILTFLENPPPWRTLCEELRPHSKYTVSNMDNLKGYQFSDLLLGSVSDYCHFDPDSEDPGRDDGTEKTRPKTLVCHDMANGYHDDSRIDGTVNYDAYTFYNWAGIDIFCYFSHHLITIPPLGWINVAHAHGVKVIGTIITEWAEGAEFWDKILESQAKYQQFASAVVAIAKTMKFDGWLLNIEHKISNPEMLLHFVNHLHKLLHSELVDPVLIWYDSVTINGKLNWQNKLNEKNKPFFDACDGFFINYSWSISDIENSVMAAGSRVTDLYVGIDIWGRNFYCGGQFNSYEAIKVAYNEGCSLAIFAPAWTHEAISSDTNDPNYVVHAERQPKHVIWLLRDRALWASIWPYVHTRLPCHLPFQTSFCRGQGKRRWQYGEVISPGPWYNMRLQQYQPNSMLSQHGYMLTPFEGPVKEKRRASKGIIKTPSQLDVADASTSTAEESTGPLKITDSLHNIAPETQDSSTAESLETKPVVQSKIAPAISNEASPHKTTAAKPILKKNFWQKICGLFKSKPKHPVERKKESYYEADRIVSHSIIETTAMPGTSTARKLDKQALPVRPARSLKGTSSIEKLATVAKLGSLERLQSPTRSGSMEKSGALARPGSAGSGSVVRPGALARSGSAGSGSTGRSVSPEQSGPPARSRQPIRPEDTESVDHEDLNEEKAENLRVPQARHASMITTSIYLNLKQPDLKTRWVLTYKSKERECLELYFEDAFNGGACLRVNPSDAVNTWHRMTRLFHCDFKCENMLIICVVTKRMKNYQDQNLNVRLKMKNAKDQDLQVVLLGRNLDQQTVLSSASVGIHYAYPLHSEHQKEFRALREYLLVKEPGFYVPIDNFYGWEIRYYKVHVPGSRVIQINCRTELPQGGILLGYLGICSAAN